MKCKKCNGKGYVFDKSSVFLTVCLPIALFIDWLEDEKNGVSRKICTNCKGTGITERYRDTTLAKNRNRY